MNKLTTLEKALENIVDGSVVMVGGFMGVGSPIKLLDGLIDLGVKDLTIIANDSDFEGKGIGRLITENRLSKLVASHIGTNPETGRKMTNGEIEVELIPQGTLVEKIRSGGAGLGGFLTPTGIGTVAEEGKQKLEIDGKCYLLETPLKAQFALIKAAKADENGNLVFRRASRNFNPVMATAADYVIAEVEEYVKVGEIDPDEVMLPGIFVDAIVKGDELNE